ncbi:MAG: hypothetical protein ABR587_11825 [Candidatus Binatia bacterium]
MIDGQRLDVAAARLRADVRNPSLDKRKHQAGTPTVVLGAPPLRVDPFRALTCIVDTDSIEKSKVLLVGDYTYIA